MWLLRVNFPHFLFNLKLAFTGLKNTPTFFIMPLLIKYFFLPIDHSLFTILGMQFKAYYISLYQIPYKLYTFIFLFDYYFWYWTKHRVLCKPSFYNIMLTQTYNSFNKYNREIYQIKNDSIQFILFSNMPASKYIFVHLISNSCHDAKPFFIFYFSYLIYLYPHMLSSNPILIPPHSHL